MTLEQQPIHLNSKASYAVLKAHDARFDGRFFIGVSSTGVYCRPVCRVKLPKEKNCTFFASAAAAEAAGFRPCRRCRPELAPGLSPADSTSQIAQQAAMIMDENCLADLKISDLADALNITDRHLRRAFSSQFGVSPGKYFKIISENKEIITLTLGYRPPYAWDELIGFLADRAIPGVEFVKDGAYRRTVAMKNDNTIYFGWVSVENKPKTNSVSITLTSSLLPVLPKVLARVRCLFDLNCSPAEIYDKLCIMNELAPNICLRGLRLPGCFDPFEISVRAILGQQVTVKSARTLARRFTDAFGAKINTPFEDLSCTFPGPDVIYSLESPIENHLGPLGITGARSRSIFALAQAIVTGSVHFTPGTDPELEMDKLLKLPGFGPWTVQYIGMRAFGWPDSFPHTDYGVKKALAGMAPKEILQISQAWRPWRSYATVNLWNSLKEKE